MAREWVNLYRQAKQAPGGRLCLNPDDEPEIQTWIDATDPGPLLAMMENFAEHGTFEQVGKMFDSIRLFGLRHEFKEMRKNMTYEEASFELAEKYGVDPRTIQNWVATEKP